MHLWQYSTVVFGSLNVYGNSGYIDNNRGNDRFTKIVQFCCKRWEDGVNKTTDRHIFSIGKIRKRINIDNMLDTGEVKPSRWVVQAGTKRNITIRGTKVKEWNTNTSNGMVDRFEAHKWENWGCLDFNDTFVPVYANYEADLKQLFKKTPVKLHLQYTPCS